MTRGRWIAVLLLAALAAGGWYATDRGYVAKGRADYAGWAERRRVEAGRRGPDAKPTLLDLALDKTASWVPGR